MVERVELFDKKNSLNFLLLYLLILSYSILMEYNNYKHFTRFDTQLINATIIKQYNKSRGSKRYQILKLKSEDGLTFYTSAKKSFPKNLYTKVKLELWAGRISFYQYLTNFYTYSRIKYIYKTKTIKQKIDTFIAKQHTNSEIASIYQALFTATTMGRNLQKDFSNLGISHLLAISGFHLGVLSALLFFMFKPIYTFFQDRYFPYRNSKLDIFIVVIAFLLPYILFLGVQPSILRAFAMLIFGFILYDRGIKIISMQILFLTIITLIAFFPKLCFSIGFWLSVSGVFYIFLFLIHFKNLNKILQFLLLPLWMYIMMLPFSLHIFENFSIYHPLSIIWTTLFTIYYPLSILLHIIGYGGIFDDYLYKLLLLGEHGQIVTLDIKWFVLHIVLSLSSIYSSKLILALIATSSIIFLYAIYQVI